MLTCGESGTTQSLLMPITLFLHPTLTPCANKLKNVTTVTIQKLPKYLYVQILRFYEHFS